MITTTQETIDLLRRVRVRLRWRWRWTKDAAGGLICAFFELEPKSFWATCWCLTGAISAEGASQRERALACEAMFPGAPHPICAAACFNDADSTTHADVLTKIDGAIERLMTNVT
jgi:hypothetical protein